MNSTLPTLLGNIRTRSRSNASSKLNDMQDQELMNIAVHTQHKDYAKLLDTVGKKELHTKVMKKKVIVPVEETVQVPVYRKEAKHKTEKVVVKGSKLIPVTKYKEVEETVLDVQEEMVNGRIEKRAVPVTRVRQIPYRDFEEREVDVEVEVPKDEIVQRKGFRMDKHVVSKVVEVEEDLVYEMRPVLVKKGERRMKELGDHHAFKKEHGAPHWDESAVASWQYRPTTPEYRSDLHRPSSAASVRSAASSMVVPRLREPKFVGPDALKSASYVPRRSCNSVPRRRRTADVDTASLSNQSKSRSSSCGKSRSLF